MKPLIAFNLWQWIEAYRRDFEPPVGNKVVWEDSQFTAMIIRGPNARRDFHVDPSDEIFYMLKGNMVLEYIRPSGGQTSGASHPRRGTPPRAGLHAPLAASSSSMPRWSCAPVLSVAMSNRRSQRSPRSHSASAERACRR
jgi:3-hydroxyanthranilic acid dioxygenase